MALIFNVTHTVTFGTFAGEDYQWELDLLRSYDDSEATPSWATDPTVQVTATDSPIEVEWMSDSDIYKPIMASRAKVALHKIAGDNLPRFTSAGQFEYQARLRYRRNGESTLNDYWCGFIQSSEGSESVSSTNPTTTFTAIDNLGGMEDTTVDVSVDSLTPINLFDKVLEAVRQTGLDLPVLVDSGIRNASGDALTDVTAHPYSLFTSDEDNVEYRNKLSSKNMIEGLLSAFNCRIFQSYGKWFIVNASTHSGSGANETATFNKYTVTNQVYTSDGTEDFDLLYNVGGSTPDLLVANSDLQLNTKRPFGSVECKPQNVNEKNYTTNGLFQSGTDGFSVHPSSFDQTLDRVTLNDITKHPSAKYALATDRNRFRLDTYSTIWFQSEAMTVDVNAPIQLSFDWMATDLNESVALNYCAVLTTTNLVTYSYNFTNNPGAYYSSAQERNFTYNFDNDDWDYGTKILSDQKMFLSKTPHQGTEMTNEVNEWQTVSKTLSVGEYYDSGTNAHTTLDGTLTIYWFYANSKRSGRKRNEGSDTNRCDMLVTNVSVKNNYSNDITKPTYERIQANYTKTEVYKPYFADNLPNSVYNRFEEERFWRKGETSSNFLTLERIITQQKLNDNRDEFRFYEGNFINISSDPIAPHHKLNMDWNNYTEAETLICVGGIYKPKDGTFDMTHYAPNQSTDIAPGDGSINDSGTVTPGFFEYDIDLVADDYTGRSSKVVYSLAIVAEGVDEFGALLTDNPLSIENIPNGVLQITGQAGDISTHVIKISVDEDFEAAASNMSFFDGTNQGTGIWQLLEDGEDTAEQISNLTFRDLGSELEIVFDLELPQRSEFEQLRIAGEVDPLLASNRDFDITFDLDASVTDASIVNDTRDLRGIPGTTANVACIITPSTDKQLDASSFTATVGTGITLIGFEQMGTSVYAEFEVTFQEDDTTITVDIDGDGAGNIPSGVETSTVTLTLSESIGNVSISRTNLTLTGIVGTTAIYDVTAYAADGFELTASNFSVTESESWLVMANAVGGGETVQIPLEITFPQADATGSATISGSAQATGSSTVSITLDFTNNVSNSSLTDTSESFILNPGQKINYTNTLTPSRGRFMNASDLTITESSSVVAFSASDAGGGSVNMSTSVTAPSSNVTIPVTLSGSVSEEPYVATVNLTEDLPQGMVKQNTLSQRFGATDSSVIFSVTVTPTEGRTEYTSGTTFTIVNGTGSNYTYANGEVTFDLTVSLPTFSSSFPIGNVSIGSSITGIAPSYTGDYGLVPASSIVQWSQGGSATTATVNFGVVSTPVPGRWIVQSTSTGITSATRSGDASSLTVVRPRTAGIYNGLPFFSTPTGSVTLVHQDDSSVTATVTIVHSIPTISSDTNSVTSDGVSAIDVNIGGTAGTTNGILYIT